VVKYNTVLIMITAAGGPLYYSESMKKLATAITVILTLCITAAVTLSLSSDQDDNDASYKDRMIILLCDMHDHAKKKDPDFKMITNGGYGLYCPSVNTSEVSREKFLGSVDGILIEDVFYGWNGEMNNPTPAKESSVMKEAISYAVSNGKTAFDMEYTDDPDSVNKAEADSSRLGSVCYAAPDVGLSNIPPLAGERINESDVTELTDATNFMALLDPEKYENTMDKDGYLNELRKTDYDLIFIDMFYRGKALTRSDVNSLRKKANGKKRLVCTYVSVGEAESYRYYWKDSWNKDLPEWIVKENPDWEGNYVVRYWSDEWKSILYGSRGAYLDRAIEAGFDGAYLDVIDAYERF
jgi:cysteinyl-tRNA synthetase